MDKPKAFRKAGIALVASTAAVLFALVAPARAADEASLLPSVVVTGSRNAGETPTEARYTGTVFEQLERASRYPTGREASLSRPSGTATVWVDLQRNGQVVGRGIESRSGSALLDRTALELVTRHRYAALPAAGWSGETRHRFVVSYRFDGPATTAGRVASR